MTLFSKPTYQRLALFALLLSLSLGLQSCKDGEEKQSSDQTAPRVSDKEILVYKNSSDSLSLQWNRAVDEDTLYDEIIYSLYISSDASMDSLNNLERFGTLILHTSAAGALGTQLKDIDLSALLTTGSAQKIVSTNSMNPLKQESSDPGGVHNLMALNITGLLSDQGYFFNVTAEDKAGNKTLYQMVNPTTEKFSNLTMLFTPPSGSYDQDRFVSFSVTPSEGSTVYLSTDPSDKKEDFKPYSSDILLQGQGTQLIVRAYASHLSYPDTEIVTVEYTVDYGKVSTPQFNMSPGTYNSAQEIPLSTATSGANIYYTVDGSTPTNNSILYTDPILIEGYSTHPNIVTIHAIAFKEGKDNSDIQSGEYKVVFDQVATLVILPETPVNVIVGVNLPVIHISTSTEGAEIYYTFDGSEPTEASSKYTTDITMDEDKTWFIQAKAFKSGMAASTLIDKTYNNFVPSPARFYYQSALPCSSYVVSYSSVLQLTCYSPVDVSMDSITLGSNIRYGYGGGKPTSASPVFDSPQTISAPTYLRGFSWHPIYGMGTSEYASLDIRFAVAPISLMPASTLPLPSYHTHPSSETVHETSCPISIQADSSTDGLTYTWKKEKIRPINVANGFGWVSTYDTPIDITSDTFLYTHDSTSDYVAVQVTGIKAEYVGFYGSTSTKSVKYIYRCTSLN